MKHYTVTDTVLRQMINELYDDHGGSVYAPDPPGGVKVNAVVDPSAAETDPMNPDYKPQNATELGVAMRALTKDMPDEKAQRVYDLVKQDLGKDKPDDDVPEVEEEEDMESEQPSGTKSGTRSGTVSAEGILRSEIRRILREEHEEYDRVVHGSDDDDEAPSPAPAVNDDEAFIKIANELGLKVSGAKQLVNKAEMRWKFLQQELPKGHPNTPGPRLGKDAQGNEPSNLNDMEVLILMAWGDYIELLQSTGELDSADVQLLHDHPEVALDLDGFRDYVHHYIERAVEPMNDRDNEGRPGDRRWLGVEPGVGKPKDDNYVAKDFDPNLKGPGKGGIRTKQNAPAYRGDFDWLDPTDDDYLKVKRKAASRLQRGSQDDSE